MFNGKKGEKDEKKAFYQYVSKSKLQPSLKVSGTIILNQWRHLMLGKLVYNVVLDQFSRQNSSFFLQ